MAVTDYTSFDDIRAALGVSEEELQDATISLDLYALNLVMELEDVSPTFISYHATVVSTPTNTRTAAQVRFLSMTKLFATYAVAKQLLGALPLFSPKEHTDGKAGFVRHQNDPYKDVKKAVEAQYGTFRSRLLAALQTVTTPPAATGAPAFVLPTLLVRSGLATDPVTGG